MDVKNIFILEDSWERVAIFQSELSYHNLFISDSVEEAIKILEENPPMDFIFLDHDLGGKILVESNKPNTGYQLAKWLKEHPEKTTGIIIIHSMNIVGAKNMMGVLEDSYFISYPRLKGKMNETIHRLQRIAPSPAVYPDNS